MCEYRFGPFWNKWQSRCVGPTHVTVWRANFQTFCFVTIEIGGYAWLHVEFGRRSFQFAILRSRNFCRYSSSRVQSLAHINPIPLFYKKYLARIMLSEMKTSRLFIFYFLYVVCRYLESLSSSRRIFLSKIERCSGCGPQHWSWGTAVF